MPSIVYVHSLRSVSHAQAPVNGYYVAQHGLNDRMAAGTACIFWQQHARLFVTFHSDFPAVPADFTEQRQSRDT